MNLSPAAAPARIAGYDYAAPTEADITGALARVFGDARGADIWARTCRIAGLSVGGVRTLSQITLCANALAAEGGAAATVSRSVIIRLRTFERLAARAAASRGEGA